VDKNVLEMFSALTVNVQPVRRDEFRNRVHRACFRHDIKLIISLQLEMSSGSLPKCQNKARIVCSSDLQAKR
jgi:hypothetical protein